MQYQFWRDGRGMSTPLSHVLSIAITTLLIVALVASATGFLDTHKQRTASDELRTIGNRLAAELASADTLAQDGEGATVSTRHPDTVAGSTYSVVLENGSSTCGALSNNTTFTCLRLETANFGVSELVPVHNETDLTLHSRGNGRFEITASGGGSGIQADPRRLELSPRVGVGQEVGSSPIVGTGSIFAQSPVPDFSLSPAFPQTNSPVEFDGTLSQDPDDSIATWEWDFDGDGTFEKTGPKPQWTYTNAGDMEVTLRVTDTHGLSSSFDREIDVVGLEYNHDIGLTANSDGFTYTVTNRHTQPVHVERILIDPADSSYDELSEDRPSCPWWDTDCEHESRPSEIEIDNLNETGTEGYLDWEAPSDELSIPEGGIIVNIDDNSIGDERGGDVTLDQDQVARVTLQDFDTSPAGENVTVGLRYRIGSGFNSKVINRTVPP